MFVECLQNTVDPANTGTTATATNMTTPMTTKTMITMAAEVLQLMTITGTKNYITIILGTTTTTTTTTTTSTTTTTVDQRESYNDMNAQKKIYG